jgi:eukaryotic-like serine/threonine-protein kinase
VTVLETEAAGQTPAVRLGHRYEILPGMPASEFRSGEAEAYRAIDLERPDAAHYALLCEPGVPPRTALIEPLAALRCDMLLRPLAWGVVDWPPRQRRSFAIVFERPAFRAIDRVEPFTDEEVVADVLPPIMAALKALFDIGLTHRAVRPGNLFLRSGDPRVLLGECASAPPASAQPMAYETIESGLAQPAGRGAGTPADDLYALGATLAALMLGHDLANGRDEEELLAAKMKTGSFVALLGTERPPLRMIEPVRGLLADDPHERWTLADLDTWMQRRSVTVRQSAPSKRAGRPLDFNDTAHVTPRLVAQAFMRDPVAAVKPIRTGELEAWLQRSLADPERLGAVALAVADAPGADGGPRDARLVARVAMALDPPAPVRYLDLAASVDGFGPALAACFRADRGISTIAEAIGGRLPQFWFGVQGTFRPEQAPILKSFDRMRVLLEDRRPGFGIARVLYELNPGLHCLAPAIEHEHAVDAVEVLPALERAAAAGRIGEAVVDRHLAAFIAARSRSGGPQWQDGLASTDAASRVLGSLKLLAYLQSHHGPLALPDLSARIGRDLPVLMARFRSKSRRERIEASLAKLVAKGDLVEILVVVADPDELRQDDREFRAACAEYAAIERDLAQLRYEAERRPQRAIELGGSIAVAAASVLAAAVTACSFWVGA